jgi:asparagine synthase (glutamine-hydrolysing)
MPGIVGFISRRPAVPWEAESQVEQMLNVMRHQPSYVSGRYNAPEMGLYAGWIAHGESFAANQVFRDEQRKVTLLFSGECFLDSETYAFLARRGYAIESGLGNWLIPLYLERGDGFFEQLNGLFSGLVIDYRHRRAFLFNDRYGMERLYWHENDDAFYFASEAKALLRILPELRVFDKQGIIEYIRFGCTICPRTLFKGIETLPPGSVWSFEGGQRKRSKYFEFQKWEAKAPHSPSEFRADFEETFKRVLPRYLQTNEEIGISLTAGLDGRIIMACLPREVRPVCYTFAGQSQNLLDAQIAAKVAAACGLKHHVLRIGPDFFNDFSLHVDRTVYITDGCLGLFGTHEAYFNMQARRLALVRITGVFGGEIFREVSFYKPMHFNRELLHSDWRDLCQNAEVDHTSDKLHPVTAAITGEIPDRRFGVIAAGRSQTVFRTPYLDNELVTLAYRTPPALRGSPEPVIAAIRNNSEQLSRIPTDLGFLGKDNSIGSAPRRMFERATFKLDYFYSEGLPSSLRRFNPLLDLFEVGDAFFGRHKFLQYRRWFQRDLARFVNEKIREVASHESELWNSAYLRGMLTADAKRKVSYSREINTILTLEAIDRLFFRGFGTQSNASARRAAFPFEQPTLQV